MQDKETTNETDVKQTPRIATRLAGGALIACVVIALLWPGVNYVWSQINTESRTPDAAPAPQPQTRNPEPTPTPPPRNERKALAFTRVAQQPARNTPGTEDISFNEHIRPILSDKCYACHGFDKNTREADLRLDTFAGATRDFGGYAAVVPGDKEKSELWLRINDKTDPMPPRKYHGQPFHKPLNKDEIELLGKWIDAGAHYEEHWSYTPIRRPEPPQVEDRAWPKNPIDRFVLAKLERFDVEPSPRADKRTLMRRVAFDLTGLPPSPERARAFMNDDSPGAYEAYVDSLLADPAYGEHLAVWWLDLVRYADTNGLHGDQPRSSWPYRDWVIRSLNDNMPFDRFTIMQLAGDLMQDPPTRDMLIASAYNRLAPQTYEGGAQPKEYKAIYEAERVTNYSEVWLGSSVGCAQCHDHKFDPYTTEDFYTLSAFFADINHTLVSHRGTYAQHAPPFMFVPQNPEQEKKVAEHDAKYQQFLEAHPDAIYYEEWQTSTNPKPMLPDDKQPAYAEQFKELLTERGKLAAQVPHLVITRQLPEPRTVRVLNRGNWQDESGKIVQPATPAFLGGPASTEDHRLDRLDLAKWTVAPDNPLTARAITNRLWARYLGSPLSANTVDLGSQGTVPTHPGLLDWLSAEFIDSGWDLRRVIRLIVTSQTYQQAADTRDALAQIDPDNERLFARQSARRLSAEAIRDQALAVSGLLTERIGGPSVFPYQPDGHWEPLNFPRRKWNQSSGDDLYRRGVYTWMQRTFPHPMMTTFDAPSRESCIGQRMVSTTPLQALGLLNGPSFVESARVLAEQLVAGHDADADRLEALFRRVLNRSPRDSERQTLTGLLASQRQYFADKPASAAKLAAAGEAPPTQAGLDEAEVAAWTSVCRVVLNLHETITRN